MLIGRQEADSGIASGTESPSVPLFASAVEWILSPARRIAIGGGGLSAHAHGRAAGRNKNHDHEGNPCEFAHESLLAIPGLRKSRIRLES